ncbi:MAG: PQQ-binding-like beta-propeller repeat protein [Planctomycetes bacterium]|nr:PQQ-binding-like beta-propeller repeat protein [Planctomycetota bacterium]
MKHIILSLTFLIVGLQSAAAGDWSQFRADASRSGYTSESLPADLSLQWVYSPAHSPRPAWRGEDTRMTFDYAYHAVAADGMVFFAGSADDKVYALDAQTGGEVWTFFADGPVRFTPAFWRGRLFVSSDDGYLYCLDARTGKLIWRKRGGPADDMVLGNGRMISRWPARGAATIMDGTVYFCAGIWPSEGIYLYALDPETGKVLWLNDSSGGIVMNQPHNTARAASGVSVQGYMAAAGDTLLVPTGRAVPAAFNRQDGKFRYFHLQRYGQTRPGAFITIADDLMVNRTELFRLKDGQLLVKGVSGISTAVFPDHIVFAQGNQIKAIDRTEPTQQKPTADGKSTVAVLKSPGWSIPCPEPMGVSLIGAGQTVIAGAKNHKIITADVQTRSVVMTADVDGAPLGLAAADGRLFVSTDRGTIYCFGAKRVKQPIKVGPRTRRTPGGSSRLYQAAAEEIIKRTGITEGYCLDLDCGDGSLSYELAKRTNLNIYAVAANPADLGKARRLLDEAGLYGTRVTVLQRDLRSTGLPNYFANLIVSGNSVGNGIDKSLVREMNRVLRPYGGVACLGKGGRMQTTTRGPLKGAGNWTHQYCDPANTGCSTDGLVTAPLGMLWFADNDFTMPSRHGRGPAPLCRNGRLFVEGLHGLRALDAYNGHVLWEYPLKDILKAYDQEHLMGAAGTGSNFCVADESLYVCTESKCLRIDSAAGNLQNEFDAPAHPDGAKSVWSYLACTKGILFGSLADTSHIVAYRYGRSDMQTQFTQSVLLFAMDARTGKLKWSYKPKHSIRNNSIAIGADKIYFIDGPLALKDRFRSNKETDPNAPPPPPALLIGLDMTNGEIAWKSSDNIYGTMLQVSEKHDILLMSYQDTRFKLASEIGGKMAAFGASDGKRLWDVEAKYSSRPILNDSTIYAQPGAWDLLTGAKKDFVFERSYGCGILAGSTNLLAFRSATLGYRDLLSSNATANYGGIRPGCWINTIPAGGLLLVPEASNRCVCSYLIKATIALQPMQQ